LNGQETEIPEGLTVTTLLKWLKLPTDRVAVERNLVIVPREQWAGTSIETGDRLEVVHFVGGGTSATSPPHFPSFRTPAGHSTDPGNY
jgi:thiamine biosynthesis protein ThiS